MQTGPSRELFELWAPDSRNGLIITGYSVEGTLARVSLVYGAGSLPCHNPLVYPMFMYLFNNVNRFILNPVESL